MEKKPHKEALEKALRELEGRWQQRDLEDQIEEEYASRGLNYKRTNMDNITLPTVGVVTIDVNDVLRLLKSGYTRFKKDDIGHGSIQERYNLRDVDVKRLFQTPELKYKKTIAPKFIVTNRVVETIEVPEEVAAVWNTEPTVVIDVVSGMPMVSTQTSTTSEPFVYFPTEEDIVSSPTPEEEEINLRKQDNENLFS